jgi:hypothetical protein
VTLSDGCVTTATGCDSGHGTRRPRSSFKFFMFVQDLALGLKTLYLALEMAVLDSWRWCTHDRVCVYVTCNSTATRLTGFLRGHWQVVLLRNDARCARFFGPQGPS